MSKNVRITIGILLMLTTLSFAEYTPKTKISPEEDDKYVLVFSDEFNLPNGSQPDSAKWSRCQRYDSQWNRWVSDSKDVIYIKRGKLVCRAIPNSNEKGDTAKMLTGAIEAIIKSMELRLTGLESIKRNKYYGNKHL